VKASRRLALSGTPIENNPGEWYTLMNNFVVPGIFGSPMEFFNRYSYPGRFGGFEGARNLGELRERSKPHYIRHNKADVATHLPPLLVKNLVLDPDEKLAAALRQAHREAQAEIAEAAKGNRKLGALDGDVEDEIETGAAMTAVGMLRLMCSSPRLIWQSEAPAAQALCAAGLVPEVDGPKLDELRLMALEMQSNDARLVVFTSFRSMAHLIAERFKEDGVRYVLFTGETSTKDRDAAVSAFTTAATPTDPGPTVFLATDAAAEGLNLGRCCSTLVNFDLSFKPSTLIQRANRIHRVDGDTTKRYLVVNLTLSRTIEEGILKLVGAKADLSDAILGEKGSRRNTTGRGGRNVFETALKDWGIET
jgi:non-specific serine/threonine protein kinase